MDHHPPWSDILNEVHLKLPPEKLTSAPKRAEQDQLKRNKTWIFKVKGPVYTERTSLKPAALLPLNFSPCYPWGLPLEEKGADCFARVFRCYVPSFPIYSERSAVAASRKKKKNQIHYCLRTQGLSPWKRQPTSCCFQQQTEGKETFIPLKPNNPTAPGQPGWNTVG